MKLHIPKPCSANWSRMTQEEKGRFCAQCQKTVIDFTKMSSEQIEDYINRNKEHAVCGRFKKNQLLNSLTSLNQQVSQTVKIMGVASVLFLWSASPVFSQTIKKVYTEDSTEVEIIEFTLGMVETETMGEVEIEEVEDPGYIDYVNVDVKPEFPYGLDSLLSYFEYGIKKRMDDKGISLSGKVYVEIIISEKGGIDHVEIIRGSLEEIHQDILDLAYAMPKWIPGKYYGVNVKVNFVVPVRVGK